MNCWPRTRNRILAVAMACMSVVGFSSLPAAADVRSGADASLRVRRSAPMSAETAGKAGWAQLVRLSAVAPQAHDAFTVLWKVNDQRGNSIPMRLGRDRKRVTAWGDEWENFGYAHLSKGHLGVGKIGYIPVS
jgi:hypothetical protein